MRSLADAGCIFASGGVSARALSGTIGDSRTAGGDSGRRAGAGTGDAGGDFIGPAGGTGAFGRFLARDDACFCDAAFASAAFIAKRHGRFGACGAFAFFVLKADAAVFRCTQAGDERRSAFSLRAGLERGFWTSKNDIRVRRAGCTCRCRRDLNGIASAGACSASSDVPARTDLRSGEFAAGARTIEIGVAGALLRGARRDAAMRGAA